MTALLITATSTTTPATFLADAAAGTVQFHRERGNGTTRRVHFLAEGTEARELANFILFCRENGAGMKTISADLHLSVAAVRRSLNDLLMTIELEEMDTEELADLLDGAAELEATEEPAEAPFICTWEGHEDAMQEAGMCPVCQ
jgi:hypothetical protein